ncbi:MAG: hypothetical protein ACFFFK_03840 [Candidatus Thorarchaeota archaeon]
MSTRYEFSKDAIQNFSTKYKVAINLTAEQTGKLTDFGKTTLLVEQITDILDEMCPDANSLKNFLEQKSEELHPISLSLYVINDDLWRIMSRKQKNPETMLPMTTIPWFYWEKNAESRQNPMGINRLDYPSFPFTTRFKDGVLTFSGRGGNFSGLIEGRIVDPHKGIRPMFIPGDTGTKKAVANYESEIVRIKINSRSSQLTLYPVPVKNLDYFYSEHPRVFYDHGIKIDADGEDVSLKVGKRQETTLRGKVMIFIGREFGEIPDSEEVLLFHTWLSTLMKIPFL